MNSPMQRLVSLAATLEPHEEASNREILQPAMIAAGENPQVPEEFRALLIIGGCTARFCGSFWRIYKSGVGSAFTHVPHPGTFDDWREALNTLSIVDRDRPMFGP